MAQRVRIYDERMDSLFYPTTGVIPRGVGRLGELAKEVATATAPRNKNGTSQGLAYRHKYATRAQGGKGRRYFTSALMNTADYAAFVHEGTVGPITAGGKVMPVGASAGNVFAYATIVRGQAANPWMERAGVSAARTLGFVL